MLRENKIYTDRIIAPGAVFVQTSSSRATAKTRSRAQAA